MFLFISKIIRVLTKIRPLKSTLLLYQIYIISLRDMWITDHYRSEPREEDQ